MTEKDDLEIAYDAEERARKKCKHVFECDEDLGGGVYSAKCVHCGAVPNFTIEDK